MGLSRLKPEASAGRAEHEQLRAQRGSGEAGGLGFRGLGLRI